MSKPAIDGLISRLQLQHFSRLVKSKTMNKKTGGLRLTRQHNARREHNCKPPTKIACEGQRKGTLTNAPHYMTFEAAIGRLHDIKQIKNKYNQLKKEWRAWSKFMDCWKGPTGIGFDQLTGLFNASSDRWAKVEKIDKECCKFITKTLEHPKLMESVFRGVVATSKYASTPGETRSELELEGQPKSPTDSRDSNEFAVYGRPRSSEMENMMNSATIKAEGSGSKQKHSSCKTMQNKHITGDTALVGSIDDLVNSVKTQSKELTINQVISMHSYTIAEAIARHYAIKGLNPTDPLLHFGVRLIDILNNWELRMSISTDQDILEWVQAKKADKASSGGPTLPSLLHNKGIRF